MGDFNSKVGIRQTREEKGIGPFGIGERNERGERLLEYVASRNLVIGNTLFRKSIDRYWTWESPNASSHNLIDYIVTNRRDILMDVTTVPKVDIGSDHRLVRSKVRMDTRLERLRILKRPKKIRIKINKLSDQSIEFRLEMKNRFASLHDQMNYQTVTESYD
ncbi:craniofacial development protein 2-like [Antedon mediterranea]|uniref:craniofacial development protein 2-like n=1 Tax=Antedon mediterranea TaxID=105859 RepID=UPI003AF67AF9